MEKCSNKQTKCEERAEVLKWKVLAPRLDIFVYQHTAQGVWLVTASLGVEFLIYKTRVVMPSLPVSQGCHETKMKRRIIR